MIGPFMIMASLMTAGAETKTAHLILQIMREECFGILHCATVLEAVAHHRVAEPEPWLSATSHVVPIQCTQPRRMRPPNAAFHRSIRRGGRN